MRKIEPTNLEQFRTLIRSLPLEDYDKLREIIEKEIRIRRDEIEGKISPERAREVLWMFHDGFYNEVNDGFSQKELRNAIRWILIKYEDIKDK